jgi:predicted metal-dependent hydrolase
VSKAPALCLPGDPPIRVALRRSARARRLTLRVSAADGTATVTLPARASRAEAQMFVESRAAWLRDHLARLPAPATPRFGDRIRVEGSDRLLRPAALRAARIEPGAILLPPGADRLGPRLLALLRSLARDRLAAACDRHEAALGCRRRRLVLRDPRSRWGSCTAAGDLMFSWRLVLAPPAVLDYVAAHEVAHLAHLDHSPAFWATVARLCPGHAAQRAWLRGQGAALHALRLG